MQSITAVQNEREKVSLFLDNSLETVKSKSKMYNTDRAAMNPSSTVSEYNKRSEEQERLHCHSL